MKIVIKRGRANGVAAVPGSKSYAHRLLVAGALTKGIYTFHNMPASDDVIATENGLRAFGYSVTRDGDTVAVGDRTESDIPVTVDCGDSASTLRFLIPLAWATGTEARFVLSETLRKRPLSVYEETARRTGVILTYENNGVTVSGKMTAEAVSLRGDISSQFVSGLLLCAPLLKNGLSVSLTTACESKPYVDMTARVLRLFGYTVNMKSRNFSVGSKRRITGNFEYTVPTDASSTAFFGALNCLGGKIALPEDDTNQPDSAWKSLVPKLTKRFCTVSLKNRPDLAPVLFVLAALCHGGRFTDTRRLAYKESDRACVMENELGKCGADVVVAENEVVIYPSHLHAPVSALDCHNDHRVAMALGVLATAVGATVDGAECVNKSFPDFWHSLKNLGIEIGGFCE